MNYRRQFFLRMIECGKQVLQSIKR
jgi:hypothetical protein